MATKFYLLNQAAPYTPATLRGAWDDTAGAVTKGLSTQKDYGGAITTVARAETNTSTTYDVLLYRGVSGPLDAQTISGTVDVVIGVLESDAAADDFWHIHIYCTQGDSDTPRGTLLTDYTEITTNEFPTTSTGRALQSAQTLSSLAISAGDRLVVEIGYIARNNSATSRTGTLTYGTQRASTLEILGDLTSGSTSTNTLAGFVSFSGSIAETPTETRLSQIADEIIIGGQNIARVSQIATEIITPAGVAGQRVSQLSTEIDTSGVKSIQLSQLAVEVMARGFRETSQVYFIGF